MKEIPNTKGAFICDGPPVPPPAYGGNLRVVKQSDPYLGADNHLMVMRRTLWDGESYWKPYEPFCTLRCALAYARASYEVRYEIRRAVSPSQ